jgi:hypothetical protein
MKSVMMLLSAFLVISLLMHGTATQAGETPELVITNGMELDKLELYNLEYVIDDSPPSPSTWPPTRIDMTGGSIGQYDDPDSGVYTYESSTFNISGGDVDYLHTYGSSTANISGGVVSNYDCWAYNSISAHNSSIFNVYEGALLFGGSFHIFDLYDSSTVNIYGGDVSLFLVPHDSSTVNLFSGDCEFGILPYDYSRINVFGGYVDHLPGDPFVPQTSTATVNIYGYDFEYDPEALWYNIDPCEGGWVSKLTGYGADGTTITFWGLKDPSTHSNVNLIPDFVMVRGVDFADYSAFASAWRTQAGSAGWNHIYDISDPNDNVIDERDLAVFAEYWLGGIK